MNRYHEIPQAIRDRAMTDATINAMCARFAQSDWTVEEFLVRVVLAVTDEKDRLHALAVDRISHAPPFTP